MEVVCYFDKDLGYSPVKKYLEIYSKSDDTLEMGWHRKQKILITIEEKFKYISQQCDGRPRPPIACPLREYSFFEIKQSKDENTLIRILYFCKDDKMVLLYAFEKPSNYDDKKIKKDIDKNY